MSNLKRTSREMQQLAAAVKSCAKTAKSKGVSLKTLFEELRVQAEHSKTDRKTLQQTYIQAAALAEIALDRTSDRRFYPTQLMAGNVIRAGGVAQMQTGEGKTLVTLLPAVWHALHGRQSHVATTNDYLAERDCEELRPALSMLGISSSITTHKATPDEAQKVYSADVVFGAGATFGFDFLKDQVTRERVARTQEGRALVSRLRRAYSGAQILQTHRDVTIIDEADSILLDEAVTPLILSGGGSPQATLANRLIYKRANVVAETLNADEHFELRVDQKKISYTEEGWELLHKTNVSDLLLLRPWNEYVMKALQAIHTHRRDVDYVVRDGEVQIVDPHTGRIDPDRSWQDGLHQAIEAREMVPVTSEGRTTARVTRQNFYRLYGEMGGMTGTAVGSEKELKALYGVHVVEIPLYRPSQRSQIPTRYFSDPTAKHKAIVTNVQELASAGRAILIGTSTIQQSVEISEQLASAGLEHTTLNGVQDAEEAEIISAAGQSGRITIATNMAGRGTDIKPAEETLAAGGLHVVATQHHQSARVDRQLIGRTGRQGQPGSYQFFISAEDKLIAEQAPALMKRMQANANSDGECRSRYESDIQRLQQAMENKARLGRLAMMEHENMLNEVRSAAG